MAQPLKMPQLSDTMSAGKILSWKKKEGDSVNRGDVLAEVETDKANLEIESFQPGTLLKIVVPAGSTATVGDTIAIIGTPGEDIKVTEAPKSTAPSPTAHSQMAVEKTSTPSAPNPQYTDTDSDRVKASPLARRLAQEKNVDLTLVQGSGPQGRIVKKDIESFEVVPSSRAVFPQAALQPAHQARSTEQPRVSTSSPTPTGAGRAIPLSKMRETIARRMQESVSESPHFYVTTTIDMEPASSLREALKEHPDYKGISINHLIIKASAYALEREPNVNRAMRNGQVWEPDQINVGIITAIEDGLLIPVIKEANRLALKDIVFEARAAVERAKAGRPNAQDLSGGSFSISNMGMFDVDNFTAIINPGQGAVLAVGSSKEVPVVKHGQVVPGLQMKVTLSLDHRVIDGIMGATFLKHFKQALEIPALMLA